MNKYIGFVVLLLCLAACSPKGNKEAGSQRTTEDVLDKPVEIKAKVLKYEDFTHEMISNGTVEAMNKVDLKFQSQEIIARILVKNGDRVRKGQVIAELDLFKLKISLDQAKDALIRAQMEFRAQMMSRMGDSLSSEVIQVVRVKSGLDRDSSNYNLAQHNLEAATLKAPFDGVVANLFSKPYNYPTSDPFCTIIDNRQPEVVFFVLDSELPLISLNDKVLVSTYTVGAHPVEGRITEINPVVNTKNQVRIKARFDNNGQFFEGMNVRIKVQRDPEKQLVIPKTALLLRSNRKVVFTIKDHRAQWKYVETSYQNSDSFVVTDGLVAGDSIIYEGNINLADQSPVKLVP